MFSTGFADSLHVVAKGVKVSGHQVGVHIQRQKHPGLRAGAEIRKLSSREHHSLVLSTCRIVIIVGRVWTTHLIRMTSGSYALRPTH